MYVNLKSKNGRTKTVRKRHACVRKSFIWDLENLESAMMDKGESKRPQ